MSLSGDREEWTWWQHSLEKNIDNRKEAYRELELSAVNPKLCGTCQSIDFNYLLFGDPATGFRRNIYEFVYLGTLQDISLQALGGCSFCADIVLPMAREVFSRIAMPPSGDDQVFVCLQVNDHLVSRYTATSHRSNGFHVGVKVNDGGTAPRWVSALGVPQECRDEYDYYGLRDSELPICLFDHELSAYRSLKQRVDLDLCRSWLEVCCDGHEACRGANSSNPSENTNDSFKLIDVARREVVRIGDKSDNRYATLSYVCGPAYTLCILQGSTGWTQDERGVWSHPLPAELPDTIEDALIVTGQLGLRYLWVDSICIAQDDEDEKHSQILAMHSIYTGAEVCIVAASGNDSKHGLPGVREPRKLRGSDVGVPLHAGRSAVLGPVRPKLHEIVKGYRWMRRAWTFQEILLARRSLIFTETEAFFFCRQKTFKESLVEDHAPTERDYWSQDAWEIANATEPLPALPPLRRDDKFVKRSTDLYGAVVRVYSQRELSYQEDGINAFRGTESLIGRILGCETIAGCPVPLLANCLAWELESMITPEDKWPLRRMLRDRRDEQDANNDQHLIPLLPSWAWAAWRGTLSIRHKSGNIGSELKILDPNVFSPIPASDPVSRYKFAITTGVGGQQAGVLKNALPVLARISWGYFLTKAASKDVDLPPYLSGLDDLAEGFVDITTPDGTVVGNCDVRGMIDPNLLANGQEAVILQLALEPTQNGSCRMLLVQLHNLLENQPELAQRLVAEATESDAVLQSFAQGPVERGQKPKKGMSPEECPAELVVPESVPLSVQTPLVATRLGVGRIKGDAWKDSWPENCLVFLA